ncbi:MAG: carnitine dehydratase [Rickettsiales bacterium]|nr:carnitine dehydratase [Rickettsiales bacterium]
MRDISILKGKLVVSIEQAVAAPYCSSKLAEVGARVIKVERKEGDFARYYDTFVKGQSTYFVWLNRGKESLIADLKKNEDIILIKSIVKNADIFIQNLLPGTLKKFGLDSSSLTKLNKKLITCDISGFGEKGPYSSLKAYDLLVQAETGLCSLTGSEESPGRVGISVCDIACGMNAYSLILEAILEREITGLGKNIKVSLFESLSEWMNVPYLQYIYTKKPPKRVGLSHPSIVPYGCFNSKDNKKILFSIQNEREWEALSDEILMLNDKLKKKFKSPSLRLKYKNEINDIIQKAFDQKLCKDILKKFKKIKIAFGMLNTIEQFSKHPHLKKAVCRTERGNISFIPPAGSSKKKYSKIPSLGEHSEIIKREFSKDEK